MSTLIIARSEAEADLLDALVNDDTYVIVWGEEIEAEYTSIVIFDVSREDYESAAEFLDAKDWFEQNVAPLLEAGVTQNWL